MRCLVFLGMACLLLASMVEMTCGHARAVRRGAAPATYMMIANHEFIPRETMSHSIRRYGYGIRVRYLRWMNDSILFAATKQGLIMVNVRRESWLTVFRITGDTALVDFAVNPLGTRILWSVVTPTPAFDDTTSFKSALFEQGADTQAGKILLVKSGCLIHDLCWFGFDRVAYLLRTYGPLMGDPLRFSVADRLVLPDDCVLSGPRFNRVMGLSNLDDTLHIIGQSSTQTDHVWPEQPIRFTYANSSLWSDLDIRSQAVRSLLHYAERIIYIFRDSYKAHDSLILFDLRTGSEVGIALRGHPYSWIDATLSPDGRRAAFVLNSNNGPRLGRQAQLVFVDLGDAVERAARQLMNQR